MRLKKRVEELEERVNSFERVFEDQAQTIKVLQELLNEARKDNRDLMNRLMSRDFEQYTHMSPSSVLEIGGESQGEAEVPLDYLAGEIVEDEA